MIRPESKTRTVLFMNDFQIFKGECERSMKPFGDAVSAEHEARLIISDDRGKTRGKSMYAIYQRSENRILEIFEAVREIAVMPKKAQTVSRFPLPKAA